MFDKMSFLLLGITSCRLRSLYQLSLAFFELGIKVFFYYCDGGNKVLHTITITIFKTIIYILNLSSYFLSVLKTVIVINAWLVPFIR